MSELLDWIIFSIMPCGGERKEIEAVEQGTPTHLTEQQEIPPQSSLQLLFTLQQNISQGMFSFEPSLFPFSLPSPGWKQNKDFHPPAYALQEHK